MENRNDSSPQYFHLVFLTLTTKEFISQERAVQNKEEEFARTCFFGNNRSAVLNSCPVNSLNSQHPFFSKQQS